MRWDLWTWRDRGGGLGEWASQASGVEDHRRYMETKGGVVGLKGEWSHKERWGLGR